MRKLIATMAAAVALSAVPVLAGPGDSWILPIDRLDGSFTTLSGAGYLGSDAVLGENFDGVRRVWWKMNAQPGMPSTKELFTIEWYVPTQGALEWQPIETANVGESEGVINAVIPWAGQFGTNHQWLGSDDGGANRGLFKGTGPGPQAPASDDFNAPGNGIYVWLDKDAQLYAKWNYPWDIKRAWSAVRVTQITPEPTSALVMLVGGALVALRRRGRVS